MTTVPIDGSQASPKPPTDGSQASPKPPTDGSQASPKPPTDGSQASPKGPTDGPQASPKRLVVLVSGSGSNLQALIDACADPAYGAEVVAVGADREGTYGAERAAKAGIPVFTHRVKDHPTRDAWDEALTNDVASYAPDLVVSAGFLKLCGPRFLAAFPGRYINTHNSLLPAFPGMNGPGEALDAGVKLAGATLFICDSGVDTGPIIAQCAVPVEDDDTVDTLTERIKEAERAQLVEAVGRMVRDGWKVEGRRVRLG